MHAKFNIDNPSMIAEASLGELFVPLGPDLIECVCALKCVPTRAGAQVDLPNDARLNPDAMHSVVVLACRVGPGEPEYYPPGFTTQLAGAAPVAFLDQAAPLLLAVRATDLAARLPGTPFTPDELAEIQGRHDDLTRPELASRL